MTIVSARTYSRRVLAIVFLALFLAIQALLWFAYYGHGAKPLIGDEANYQATAIAILGGGAWMPSTIWPPLQPLLIAAIYAVFGVHLVAVQIVQTLLLIGCAALLRSLWRRFSGSVAAANTATAMFLLNPATAAYAHWLWPETVHLLLLLLVFWLLARPLTRLASGLAGACVGLAILAKSLLMPFWPLFLLAFVRRAKPHLKIASALLFAAALALVTAPALVHGWRSFGKPMIADSSMYNLWVGLTDQWRSDYVADMGGATLPAFLASGATPQQRNAIYLEKVREKVAEHGMGAVLADQLSRQYFRLFSAKTPLLSQLPGPACAGHLSTYTTAPWLTRTLTWLNNLAHALMLVAAAFGIVCWRWRSPLRAFDGRNAAMTELLIALFFAYQLALFALIHVKARFALPMIPFLCGFGGSFLVALRKRWVEMREPVMRSRDMGEPTLVPSGVPSERFDAAVAKEPAAALEMNFLRLGGGALLAALLLFLAFAGPALDHLCAR